MFFPVNAFSPAISASFVGACAPPTALYHFNDSYVDAAGNHNDWVPVGGTTFGDPKFGSKSIIFDGNSPGGATCAVKMPESIEPFNPVWTGGPSTIDFQFNPNTVPSGVQTPSLLWSGDPNILIRAYVVHLFEDGIRFYFRDNDSTVRTIDGGVPSTGVFHHVALISLGVGQTFHFCVDGESLGSFATPGYAGTMGRGSTTLGAGAVNGSEYIFDGRIDELRWVPCAQWTTFPFTPPAAPYLPA